MQRSLLIAGRNALVITLYWVIGFLLMQRGVVASGVAEAVAAAAGIALAVWLRARIALFLIAGLGVFVTAELAIHAIFGGHVVQGAPQHFAVLAAAFLGVTGGALLVARGRLREV